MKISKLFAGTMAGILASISLGTAVNANAADLSLGDPSGDGIINAVDASYILTLYANSAVSSSDITNELISLCDVNKDGSVNAMDASYVLSYYVDQSLNSTDISIEEFIDEFISELTAWEWPDTSSLDPQDPWNPWAPWNPWNPASSLSPDYQIDPDVDWTSFLPEGFLDEENPWTWPGSDSSPWENITDYPWYANGEFETLDEWYKNFPTGEIDNWSENTLDMLKEIDDTTNENE